MTKRFGSSLPQTPEGHVEGAVIAEKYRLERLLGEGGGGSVWHATNLQLEVPVAIKLLRAGPARRELGERLRVEARAAARLVHPSIVRVFDIGEANPGEPFIVMELLSGESLSDRIHRDRPGAIEAVQLLLPIAEALTVAHAAGVVHRDLKPDNVILCEEGDRVRPKLLDFGVAKIAGGNGQRANITQRGALVGSPSYMSPEQARAADNIDFRSDIWSFCVVLYETLSGAMPFDGPDGGALLRAVIKEPPRPLTRVPGVDRQLWSLIEQGLSKTPSLRPSSMLEVGRELARWLRRHGVEHDSAGTPLDAKWLPRMSVGAGLAVARAPGPSGRASLPSFSGEGARRPSRFAPAAPSTLEPVARAEPRRGGARRGSKKARRGDEQWLVVGATSATLLAVFLGVAWAVGGFDDERPALASSRFEAPAGEPSPSMHPMHPGMQAGQLGAVGALRGLPASVGSAAGSAPVTASEPTAAPAAFAPPAAPARPAPSPADPPAAPARAAAPRAPAAPARASAPAAAPAPAAPPASPAQKAPSSRPSALASTLNTLAPPPPKRPDARSPKLRMDSPGDLLAPY